MGRLSKVLVVDDKPANLIAMTHVLADPKMEVVTADSGSEALRLVLEHEFDLILLDVQMPQMDGFETAHLIHGYKSTEDLPIMFVSAVYDEPAYTRKGYACGGVDYVVKPIDPEVLKSKVQVFLDLHKNLTELKQSKQALRLANEQLALQAATDALTGLFNRRKGVEILHREMSRGTRDGNPLSIVMLDVDYFKQINDTRGHNVGDRVLTEIASRLKWACRKYDYVVRWGGEEILVICPNTNLNQIISVAHRCHSVIAFHPIEIDQWPIWVTVSLGTASTELFPELSIEELLIRADKALYQAKASGRNCIRAYSKMEM